LRPGAEALQQGLFGGGGGADAVVEIGARVRGLGRRATVRIRHDVPLRRTRLASNCALRKAERRDSAQVALVVTGKAVDQVAGPRLGRKCLVTLEVQRPVLHSRLGERRITGASWP
jgi:hypothetical protein